MSLATMFEYNLAPLTTLMTRGRDTIRFWRTTCKPRMYISDIDKSGRFWPGRSFCGAQPPERLSLRRKRLQCTQESDQIGLLARGELAVEALVVEIHDLFQRRGHAIVEERRTRGHAVENRPLELANVDKLT